MISEPRTPREFAVWVAAQLTEAGFQALWAGGCVRDALLDSDPKDFDVATSARPEDVVRVFGRRRTVMVGAAFGVVVVTSPHRNAGQVEVATFRADGEYTDGRRPDSVQFCSAREDALRRDFTINGMFYDPVRDSIIDYVGGQQDLRNRVVRAIGDAEARFTEDRLRILRAVRFTATLGFELDPAARAAVAHMASSVTTVSIERIAQEMKRMLAHPHRVEAVQLLRETGLLTWVLPEADPEGRWELHGAGLISEELGRLQVPAFETAAAVLFQRCFRSPAPPPEPKTAPTRRARAAEAVFRRWRLSNQETKRIAWLVTESARWDSMDVVPHHVAKPVAAHADCALLADLLNAQQVRLSGGEMAGDWLLAYRDNRSPDELNPAVLLNGEQLRKLGVASGPTMGTLLKELRRRQLDEEITNSDQAAAWVAAYVMQ